MKKNKSKELQSNNYLLQRGVTIEIVGIIIILVLLVVGTLMKIYYPSFLNNRIGINNIESFSLTILQIQATVCTLSIALVAIMSGSISEEHMGISISNYYLNTRPMVFKQKRLIITVLVLLFFNVILHINKNYIFVLVLFSTTVTLVIISTIEIYALFRGKTVSAEEIESYIDCKICNEFNYDEIKEQFYSYGKNWMISIKDQSVSDFEKHLDFFLKYVVKLLSFKNENSIRDIEKISTDIFHYSFKRDDRSSFEKSIRFLMQLYELAYKAIREMKPEHHKIKVKFEVFGKVMYTFKTSIDYAELKEVEENLDWDYLSFLISALVLELNYDAEESDRIAEFEDVQFFSRYIGAYLANQKKKMGSTELLNAAVWGKMLKHISLYTYSSQKNIYGIHMAKVYFNYVYGFLTNQFEHIVKEYFYRHTVNNRSRNAEKHFDLLVLSIHCYLYYLAYKESDECIVPELRESAKLLIDDKEIKAIFGNYIREVCYHSNSLLFDSNYIKDITLIIKPFELFPKYSGAKRIILPETVKEFCLFLATYAEVEYYNSIPLDKLVNEDTILDYIDYFGRGEEYINKVFIRLYSLISPKEMEQKELQIKIDMLYGKFRIKALTIYKNAAINRANLAEVKYNENIDIIELKEIIKEKVYTRFIEKFKPLINTDSNAKKVERIRVLRFVNETKSISENNIDYFYSTLEGNFISYLVNWLYKSGAEVKFRERFTDDQYVQFLKDSRIDTLVGSSYILKNRDYLKKEGFESFKETCECIFVEGSVFGLAMQSGAVDFSVRGINVSIHPMTIRESEAKFDAEKRKYVYEITSDVIAEFDKEELKEYLKNNYKILDITIKVAINYDINKPCYIFSHKM